MPKLSIIKETKHWLAINKQAGLIVERNPFETPTIETLVTEYLSQQYRNPYVGIAHRLDRVTSGVLLIAKKKSALRKLNEQFRERSVQKIYFAIVENKPLQEEAILVDWLLKDQKNKRAIIYEKSVEGSGKVELKYRIVEQLSAGYLLEVKPKTGKFHQIRVQLSNIGCPILGDEKYGAQQTYFNRAIALHAQQLSFNDPSTNERITLIADFPKNNVWKNRLYG
ncbi:MAG: RluA family pseudouridine synthase [Bacteroidota bacterium]